MPTLVLLRHGESQWNQENRFTGWVDVDLTDKGRDEARQAGRMLRENHFEFDLAFTSTLRRALWTLWLALDELDQLWIPMEKSWRLNERHYGDLQGRNKTETAAVYGEDQVLIWRRSYDIPPPLFKAERDYFGERPRAYADLLPEEYPLGETLKDTVARVIPYWEAVVAPQIRAGKRVIIAAHGNSLRALVKHLDNIPDQKIIELNIPTGIPLVYELDDSLRPLRSAYLGDPAEVAAAAAKVASQGKAE